MEFVDILNAAAGLVSIGVDKLALLLAFFVVYKFFTSKEAAQAMMASLKGEKVCNDGSESVALLLPILTQITDSIQKVSGNDLTHIQRGIDGLADCLNRRMDNLDDKLSNHDKQAVQIKDTCDNIWTRLNQP
jgi:hypothetical protein